MLCRLLGDCSGVPESTYRLPQTHKTWREHGWSGERLGFHGDDEHKGDVRDDYQGYGLGKGLQGKLKSGSKHEKKTGNIIMLLQSSLKDIYSFPTTLTAAF